jgi:hypothetical protein
VKNSTRKEELAPVNHTLMRGKLNTGNYKRVQQISEELIEVRINFTIELNRPTPYW